MAAPSQNIYDDPEFFNTYSTLPRSEKGHDGAPEWPTLRSVLGNISGSRVLDLGCGYGWFSRWARDEGHAKSVRGVDISANMISKAQEFEEDRYKPWMTIGIDYEIADLETLELRGKREYDVVYSSLAFHYIADIRRLFHEIHSSLSRRGKFVFSVEHPIFTAPSDPKFEYPAPTVPGESSKATWQLDSYANEGLRVTSWLNAKGVRKYHRTIETYLTVLLEVGFEIKGLKEWMPSVEDVVAKPE